MARKADSKRGLATGQVSLFSKETPDAFRKAVQVVHSKPKQPLSLVQRKLGNAWLKNAIEKQPTEDGWWELGTKQLATSIGFDSNNRKYLTDSAEALMRVVFEWDVLAQPNKRVPWKASVLFPEIEIHADTIRYQISAQMRERLMNPDMYALIDMNVVRRFRRASSLAIWEFCIRYEKIGLTAEVEWEQFRDMILGESADAKTYKEYKFFKMRALTPSVAEINSESNHTIILVEKKLGRRIHTLRFEVKKKSTADDAAQDDMAVELVSEMVKLGVPQSEAKKLCVAHDYKAIRGALEYTRQRINDKKKAKIDKPAAYFRQALAKGYASDLEAAKSGADKTGASAGKQKKVDIKEEYRAHQIKEAERYFAELDASDQAAQMEKYNAQQVTPLLRLSKKATSAAQASFFGWLANETWGEPSTEELLSFAQTMLEVR